MKKSIMLFFITATMLILPACYVNFEKLFFTEDEYVLDKEILGTWRLKGYNKNQELVFLLDKENRIQMILKSPGKIERTIAKTYIFENKKFLCYNNLDKKYASETSSLKGELTHKGRFWIVVPYRIDKNSFYVYGLKTRTFKTMIKNKELKGFRDAVIFITSDSKTVRSAIKKIGVDAILANNKRNFFKFIRQ